MRVPSYRRHSSGQARVTLDGTDHLLGPFGSRESKAKYSKLVAKHLAKMAKDPSRTLRAKSIGACLLAFLDDAKANRSKLEYEHFVRALEPLSSISKLSVRKFGPNLFRKVREHWLSQDVSRTYANSQMNRVRHWAKWCVAHELMPSSIYQAIRCVEPLRVGKCGLRETEAVKPVSDGAIEATIPHLPQVVADMVRFQRLTGARPGEVCAITPAMVDRSRSVWEIELKSHKTAWRGKRRTIYIGSQAQSILKPYLERDAGAACFSPREAMEQRRVKRAQKRVTPRNQGNGRGYTKRSRANQNSYEVAEAYTTATYGRAIKYACKLAEISVWSPNQLRHSRATELRKQFGLDAAAVILGHSELGVMECPSFLYQWL